MLAATLPTQQAYNVLLQPLAALNRMRTNVLNGTIPSAVSNTGATLSAFLKSDPLLLVAMAINQCTANQQTLQQQFAAFTMQRNTSYQPAQVVQPPITQFLIPNFASFPTVGHGGGRHGGSGRGEHANLGHTSGRNLCTPLQTLLDGADKGGCPPLAAEADKLAVWPLACINPHNATWLRCTPTLSSNMQIGMCVFHAGLMSKMGIHPKHARPPGDAQITRMGLIGKN
jgi:hypothetical protein